MNLNLTSPLDYFIAISGILIIIGSFAWNIYDIFIHKSVECSSAFSKDSDI